MKKFVKAFITGLFILTACSVQEPAATSANTPSTEVTSAENNCTEKVALQKAIDFFSSYSEFSVSYSRLNEQTTLTVWLVIPEINPNASDEEEIKENAFKAMEASLAPQISLVRGNECIAKQFAYIEMIVVDKEYHGWVSQKIKPQDIPGNANADNPSSDDVDALFQQADISYWRTTPTEKLLPNKEPTWHTIHKKIIAALPNKTENSGFTVIVDKTGIDVIAQWQEAEGSEEDKFADMMRTVETIVSELNLMTEKPNALKFSVVDKKGNFQIIGIIPQLDLEQAQVYKAPFDDIP